MNDYLRERRRTDALSLDEPLDGGGTAADLLETREESGPDDTFESMISELGDRDREVMRGYFVDEMSMKDVGDRIGVSESRVSQMIKFCKGKVRRKLLDAI